VRRPAGWVILAQIAFEIAALSTIVRVIAKPRFQKTASRVGGAPSLPAFITEVEDSAARRYSLRAPNGLVHAGFYSDGRVRLLTPDGGRFSGVVVDKKVVLASLRDDVSFEMEMIEGDAGSLARISGGPYDGRTLSLEPIAS